MHSLRNVQHFLLPHFRCKPAGNEQICRDAWARDGRHRWYQQKFR
jgi:hypothetical protein